jgi:hypothetical protein
MTIQPRPLKREQIEKTIRTYFDGCNEANIEKMLSCFVPDAQHYFPRGAPQGPFLSARAIAEGWKRAVETWGSFWTIDLLLIDEVRNEAAMEWTHFKRRAGLVLRGAELYSLNEDGLITEIRAYYASPISDPPVDHELGGFDYDARGYPIAPPGRSDY